jgi:excisionase family DNA binding protein
MIRIMTRANEPSLPDVTFMKVQEVADYLRTSKMSVNRWIRAGKLPAVKVGREYRIDQREVLRLATPIELP